MKVICFKLSRIISSQTSKDRGGLIYLYIACFGMAAVPNSFLMAKTRMKKKETSDRYRYSELKNQPLCYNTKMMNSIWGQYNMYSVHNIKAVQNGADGASDKPLHQMLQGMNNEHCINISSAENAWKKASNEYAGQQLNKFQQPAFKKFAEFFGHGNA